MQLKKEGKRKIRHRKLCWMSLQLIVYCFIHFIEHARAHTHTRPYTNESSKSASIEWRARFIIKKWQWEQWIVKSFISLSLILILSLSSSKALWKLNNRSIKRDALRLNKDTKRRLILPIFFAFALSIRAHRVEMKWFIQIFKSQWMNGWKKVVEKVRNKSQHSKALKVNIRVVMTSKCVYLFFSRCVRVYACTSKHSSFLWFRICCCCFIVLMSIFHGSIEANIVLYFRIWICFFFLQKNIHK